LAHHLIIKIIKVYLYTVCSHCSFLSRRQQFLLHLRADPGEPGNYRSPLEFSYTAAFGKAVAMWTDTLPAGRQRILPDAIAYLRVSWTPYSRGPLAMEERLPLKRRVGVSYRCRSDGSYHDGPG
jgi:hypothetical protein